LVILEGVGAACRKLMYAVDAVIWVQSDLDKAKLRGLARDIAETGDAVAATAFWDEWTSAELTFQAEQRPWERADFIVSGTPDLEHNAALEVVVAQKPPRSLIKAITSS
jgi:uridine kinase